MLAGCASAGKSGGTHTHMHQVIYIADSLIVEHYNCQSVASSGIPGLVLKAAGGDNTHASLPKVLNVWRHEYV